MPRSFAAVIGKFATGSSLMTNCQSGCHVVLPQIMLDMLNKVKYVPVKLTAIPV